LRQLNDRQPKKAEGRSSSGCYGRNMSRHNSKAYDYYYTHRHFGKKNIKSSILLHVHNFTSSMYIELISYISHNLLI
jgi:hypothetical protein